MPAPLAHPSGRSSAIALTACLCMVMALASLAFPRDAGAEPDFPPLTGRVVDQAGILDPGTEARLSGILEAHEKKTTNQLVVVTVSSLQGEDIRSFGYKLGRHWGIGQEGEDNGVLLLVAPNERKVSIEVGYGLEGTLTDAASKLIIENTILPAFRGGDMPAGIENGAEAIIGILSGTDTVEAEPRSHPPQIDQNDRSPQNRRDRTFIFSFAHIFFCLVAVAMIVSSLAANRDTISFRDSSGQITTHSFFGALWKLLLVMNSGGGGRGDSSRRSHWSRRSGRRGGSSFRGGGGSFGGGGASGGW